MLDAGDLTQMQADALALRNDNAVSITIRRGNTTLAAQTVRLLKRRGGTPVTSRDGAETRAPVLVMGATALNIQIDDRFTIAGVLYRVTFVQPDQRAATMAEAEIAA